MSTATTTRARRLPRINWVMLLYLLFLMLPIYWLINMSLKTNDEILGTFSLWPQDLTFQNYATILTDSSWYMGYVNSIIYVTMNTLLSVAVALPAAYAFSRYNFLGDKHLFFWLLTNRMAPPAVFALPFFQLYSSVGLFDTHIFNQLVVSRIIIKKRNKFVIRPNPIIKITSVKAGEIFFCVLDLFAWNTCLA